MVQVKLYKNDKAKLFPRNYEFTEWIARRMTGSAEIILGWLFRPFGHFSVKKVEGAFLVRLLHFRKREEYYTKCQLLTL